MSMERLLQFIDHVKGRGGWRGFALVEVLSLVAILGILAGTGTLAIVGLAAQPRVHSCHQGQTAAQGAIVANGPSTIFIPRSANP
jgi:hypothetical protein